MAESFDIVLTGDRRWFQINLKEVWKYRDLIFMFVKRTFVAKYKQTILGPAWAIVQPLLSTVVFTIVFGRLAKLPTDGVPPFLFYMCGTTAWGYFVGCLNSTSVTFSKNAHLLSKVYFPRLVIPISDVITELISFFIQVLLMAGFLVYYSWLNHTVYCTARIIYLPLLLLNMAMLGLGTGVIISAMTTKYRDLGVLVSFLTRLWMYATPVVYSLDMVPQRWRWLYLCNPMAVVIELFKGMFFTTSAISGREIAVCWSVSTLIMVVGVLIFSQVEKNFVDTI